MDAETSTIETSRPADASTSWVDTFPAVWQGFLRLSRFDRPIGFWLLALPCWMGLVFASEIVGWQAINLWYAIAFGVGAVAMRGAGCTYNDIADRELDAQVERTAGRPLPSGQVTVTQAWLWLFAQVAIGFLVWLTLPLAAKLVALLAIPLVAAYPFMKRITWWPQAWLGLTFNFGFPIGYLAADGSFSLLPLIFFAGLVAWTIGYDTIYARQDVEDDALVGIRSTARLFGDKTVPAVTLIYGFSALCIGFAMAAAGSEMAGALTGLAFLAHLTWQVWTLRHEGDAAALRIFKSNRAAGLILVLGMLFTVAFILQGVNPSN